MFDPTYSMFDIVLLAWIMMSILVGYGAVMERNRSFLAWYLISLVLSPFLAAFILLKLLQKEPAPPKSPR